MASLVDDLMSSFYSNDLTNKDLSSYEKRVVMSYEMRSELNVITKKHKSVKTGYQRVPKQSNIYIIYYK